MQIQKIVLPTDFSRYSDAAVALVSRLLEAHQCEATVLHIDPTPGISVAAPEPFYVAPQVFATYREWRDREAETKMKQILDRLGAGGRVTSLIGRTDVVTGIVNYAAESRADLIVMGARGEGVTRFFMGGVTQKVSQRASTPVLVVHELHNGEVFPPFRRILVAVDYSRFSIPLARLGSLLLAPGGIIEFIHVWRDPYHASFDQSLGTSHGEFVRASEKARSDAIAELERFVAELPVDNERRTYLSNEVSTPAAILDRALETRADLIMVGAHSRKGLAERVMGTVADRVLRHSSAPVLLFPNGALENANEMSETKEDTP